MLIPMEDKARHAGHRRAYSADPDPQTREMGQGRELFGLRKDQSRFMLEIGLTPLEIGGTQHTLASVIDITERTEVRRKLEQYASKLEAQNKDLQRFVYVVSDDLKSPLRGMANLATWILEDLGGKVDSDTQENLELIRTRAEKLFDLVEGILAYSRSTRAVGEPEPVDSREVIQAVLSGCSPNDAAKVRVEGEFPVVFYDPTQFYQVAQNLIQNALDHGPAAGGEVVVSCDDRGCEHGFRVWNNGEGIEPQHVERIFELFQTIPRADGQQSTGIGLSIVKRIVEQNGGRVTVESEPGVGTSFVFTVPSMHQ